MARDNLPLMAKLVLTKTSMNLQDNIRIPEYNTQQVITETFTLQ